MSMEKRFAAEIKSRFEQIEDFGFATLRSAELKRWYGRERLGKGVWRDIEDRWLEMEFEVPLLVGIIETGWTLAWGKGLKAADDSWLRPVGEFAQRDEDDE
jgi:hypothetical protein